MPTATPTATEVSLVVALAADGRSVVRELRGAPPLGLRELRGSGEGSIGARPLCWRSANSVANPARVAIVQTAACLVAGDDVRLRVRVEDGAALALTEISATLAHPGGAARQRIELEVGDGARLVFAEQPLIVAAGAELERRLTLTLGAGARVVHRETLVLGRHGEEPGAARLRLRVERGAMPVLDETFQTADLGTLRSAAVVGDAGAIGSLGRYGIARPAPDDAFALGPEDTLIRRIVSSTRDLRELDALQRAWTEETMRPNGR